MKVSQWEKTIKKERIRISDSWLKEIEAVRVAQWLERRRQDLMILASLWNVGTDP
jgi:hypothetical protein